MEQHVFVYGNIVIGINFFTAKQDSKAEKRNKEIFQIWVGYWLLLISFIYGKLYLVMWETVKY